jgi:Leucine-rich repeat (LRR) protein
MTARQWTLTWSLKSMLVALSMVGMLCAYVTTTCRWLQKEWREDIAAQRKVERMRGLFYSRRIEIRPDIKLWYWEPMHFERAGGVDFVPYGPEPEDEVRVAGNRDLFETLAKMKHLGFVSFDFTDVQDQDLIVLSSSESIRRVLFSRNHNISDTGVRALAAMKNLEMLYISGTAITDNSAEPLSKAKSLRQLDVGYTAIGDKFVAGMINSPLRTLDLSGTKVTDDCLSSLEKMSALQEVSLCDTAVSESAKQQFAKQMPSIKLKECN